MRERISKATIIKYAVTFAAGLVLAFLYCLMKGLFESGEEIDRLRIVCDGVTLSGVLMLCVGLLTLVNKEGIFDGLGYSFRSMRRVFLNYRWDDKDTPKTYYDYKQSVDKKRKISWNLIIVGLCFLAVAILLAIIHG